MCFSRRAALEGVQVHGCVLARMRTTAGMIVRAAPVHSASTPAACSREIEQSNLYSNNFGGDNGFHVFCVPLFFLAAFFRACDFATPCSVSSGLDDRDAAFVERLKNLAQEALTWPHLGERQRLVWAAVLELDAVPLQEPAIYHMLILNVSCI